MSKGRGGNFGEEPKRNANDAPPVTSTRSIATTGEVFADGSAIELIGGAPDGKPRLMLWDGAKETVGASVEHHGQLYEPASIHSSILQELTLPTRSCPYGTKRVLLAEISELVANFAGLPEKTASLAGRFVLCSCLGEALQVAPALVLSGPDKVRGKRLVALLHCLCWRGLGMTAVTPASLRSLPSGVRFTFLISQSAISGALERLLDDASRRDQKIPYRGGLLDLFGAQVIHAESIPFGEPLSLRSIQIPMIPGGAPLPNFDPDVQHRIAADLQPKLLNFRRVNLSAACKLQFDSSKFIFPLRELAHGFAAATPDDAELQAEVFDLLQEKDEEIREGKWIELSAVAVESILVACQESPEGSIYVGELAEIAQEILRGRGKDVEIDPGVFGKQLKVLGFKTEPRNAKGVKFRWSEDLCRRARQLARDLGAPQMEDAESGDPTGKGGE